MSCGYPVALLFTCVHLLSKTPFLKAFIFSYNLLNTYWVLDAVLIVLYIWEACVNSSFTDEKTEAIRD
jgi:hypothetical protein